MSRPTSANENNTFSFGNVDHHMKDNEDQMFRLFRETTINSWDSDDGFFVEEPKIIQQAVMCKPRPRINPLRRLSSENSDDKEDIVDLWDDDDFKHIFSQKIELTFSEDSAVDKTPYDLSTPVVPHQASIFVDKESIDPIAAYTSSTANLRGQKVRSIFSHVDKVHLMVPNLNHDNSGQTIATKDDNASQSNVRRVTLDSETMVNNTLSNMNYEEDLPIFNASPTSVAYLELQDAPYIPCDVQKLQLKIPKMDTPLSKRRRTTSNESNPPSKVRRLNPPMKKSATNLEIVVQSVLRGELSIGDLKCRLVKIRTGRLILMAVESRVTEAREKQDTRTRRRANSKSV